MSRYIKKAIDLQWSAAADDRLRGLWDTGKSASEIAKFMPPLTKNAILGRARRMGLPGRPSPLKNGSGYAGNTMSDERKQQVRDLMLRNVSENRISLQLHCGRDTIRKLRGEMGIARPPVVLKVIAPKPPPVPREPTLVALRAPPQVPVPKAAPKPLPLPILLTFPTVPAGACCWPIGEPRTKAFRFCEAAVVTAGFRSPHSYCLAHRAVAYMPPMPRRAPGTLVPWGIASVPKKAVL
jgi:GcrA cell cycle regulator